MCLNPAKEDKMYCTNCGTQNPDDTNFCDKCGNNLSQKKIPLQAQISTVPARNTDGLAVAALVLGAASFLPPFAICSVPAIILGAIALNRIKRDPTREGKGMALAGLICGSVVLFIWICLIIFGLIFAITTVSTSSGVSVSLLARQIVF
jgi:ribosomal protein L40E